MKLNCIDRIDNSRDEGKDKVSNVKIMDGLIGGHVYHYFDEKKLPWNGQLKCYSKSYGLIGYPTMDAAKEAVENKLDEIINKIREMIGNLNNLLKK